MSCGCQRCRSNESELDSELEQLLRSTGLNDQDLTLAPEFEAELQGEVNRRSTEYIRWVQKSLNRLIQAGLVVDGISGPKTRSAVREFQRRARIAIDGIVGPQTEGALLAWGAEPPPGMAAPPAPPTPPSPAPPQPKPEPPKPPQPRDCDGRRQLAAGIWNGNTTLTIQGGQLMVFLVKNLNVLGTTIRITDHGKHSEARVIPPQGTVRMEFSIFGCEPMGWRFNIRTESDVFLVGWRLCSTWIPGDPRNC